MPSLRVRVGRAVRRLRLAAGLSQERFADQLKLHRTFIGLVERGQTNVSLSTLERIARGLRVTPCQLMCEAEKET